MRAYEFYLEGLSVYRAVDRLSKEGIEVLSARRTQKNGLILAVNANDRKKAFAILNSSCYNIKKSRPAGAAKLISSCLRAAGLFAGAIVALCGVFFLQGRVLRVSVTGSGAYLEPEIRAILAEEGVGLFSDMPEGSAVAARILALPRVHFCTVKGEGGVLTVCVEVGEELSPLKREPLLSPASGVVEQLVVLRGTPLVKAGDNVERGQTLVEPYALAGEAEEKLESTVVAFVRIAFPVSAEYELGEEAAKLQAELDFGQIEGIHTAKTEKGWRVEGTGHAEASLNFG